MFPTNYGMEVNDLEIGDDTCGSGERQVVFMF